MDLLDPFGLRKGLDAVEKAKYIIIGVAAGFLIGRIL